MFRIPAACGQSLRRFFGLDSAGERDGLRIGRNVELSAQAVRANSELPINQGTIWDASINGSFNPLTIDTGSNAITNTGLINADGDVITVDSPVSRHRAHPIRRQNGVQRFGVERTDR
jgi:hypothetical protein